MRCIALWVLFGSALAVCPPDSEKSASRPKCFKFYDTPMIFTQAQEFCEKLGSHLASISDGPEAQATLKMAAKTTSKTFWIGMAHTLPPGMATEGTPKKRWLDGTPFKFTRWRFGMRTAPIQCIAAKTSDGRWTAAKCARKLPFMCISDDKPDCPTVTCPNLPTTVTCSLPNPPVIVPNAPVCPNVTCPAVTCPPVPTVTCPTSPPVTTPTKLACPTVTCPTKTCTTVPTLACPDCPPLTTVTWPAIPTVTCPDCPSVTCPAVTCPTVPTVTCSDCPIVTPGTCPTIPIVTCPTSPAITTTPPPVTCPNCPPMSCPTVLKGLDCPQGFIYFPLTKSCYTVLTDAPMNYTQAEAACVQLGAHLVSIHSKAENDFVLQIAHTGMPLYYLTQHTWIGLYRHPVRRYEWLYTDGTPNDYNSTWLWGAPNDYGGNEDCVQILADIGYGDPFTWSDYQCYQVQRASVCKMPSTS